jgi:uncharacterized protein with PIN domain
MKLATFYFNGELNDLLPAQKRGSSVFCSFQGDQSIKHLIESLGIPHTEVGYLRVNGLEVDFSYITQDGDQIEVSPIPLDTEQPGKGSLTPLVAQDRFVLDNHLGRLAVYLRMLGFDSLYRNDYQDEELAQTSHQQERILLTRDRRLLMRNQVVYGYLLRSKVPRQQLVEVLRRFQLYSNITPFRRCLRCNALLQEVSKAEILGRLQPLTKKYFNEFHLCPQCEHIYWKGSHYERMMKLIAQVDHPQVD